MLGNTYHLGNRPGVATLEAVGGLHNFMNWKRALLTGTVILSYLKVSYFQRTFWCHRFDQKIKEFF